ncbi:MAG: phosphomethylpyrimidine synthase ThiC [Patescibacteria group bacterium]
MHSIEEIRLNILSKSQLNHLLKSKRGIILNGRKQDVYIGHNSLIKVGTQIGLNESVNYQGELDKVRALVKLKTRPDVIYDLSTVQLANPLYKGIIKIFDGPVATVPVYSCFDDKKGISPENFLKEIENQAKARVSLMVLHPTATKKLYEKAKRKRLVPVTSRGGACVIKDMYINNRDTSVPSIYFDRIISVLKRYDVAVSLALTFRGATASECLDEIALEEFKLQEKYIKAANKKGLKVVREGVSHASLDKIDGFCKLFFKQQTPIIPLGPVTTDAASGEDHIASAIGSAYMAYRGYAHMIVSVTRSEHTGGVPSLDNVVEGYKAARIAAHSVNIAKFSHKLPLEEEVNHLRGKYSTCIVSQGLFSDVKKISADECGRCKSLCPYILLKDKYQN